MAEIKDGGPAFPVPGFTDGNGNTLYPEYGLTLRDYFAGQALAGCLAGGMDPSVSVKTAYLTADAMLAARGE